MRLNKHGILSHRHFNNASEYVRLEKFSWKFAPIEYHEEPTFHFGSLLGYMPLMRATL